MLTAAAAGTSDSTSTKLSSMASAFVPLCFISLFLLGICTPHPRRDVRNWAFPLRTYAKQKAAGGRFLPQKRPKGKVASGVSRKPDDG